MYFVTKIIVSEKQQRLIPKSFFISQKAVYLRNNKTSFIHFKIKAMKKTLLILSFIVSIIIGCDNDSKNTPKNVNFYDNSHRIGLWATNRDTLNFIDDKNLIIQSGEKDEFDYKIKDNKLILIPQNAPKRETSHLIEILDKYTVRLGGMQPTTGFGDGSGFYKKIK